jgi:ubiquinone/menaquinone biosynthesis C-methylase UbiE
MTCQPTVFTGRQVTASVAVVNENHRQLCGGPEWAAYMRDEVLPPLAGLTDFGDHMLEVGPGPGAATEWLRHQVERLTVIEIDDEAAARLAERYVGGNVAVVVGSAAALSWPDDQFDSVGSFTMLHHIPTPVLQNRVLAEALRVLRPGGTLVASDSLPGNDLHHFHVGDTYNPIDPGSLIGRLQALGYDRITVTVDDILRFVAHKPVAEESGCSAN